MNDLLLNFVKDVLLLFDELYRVLLFFKLLKGYVFGGFGSFEFSCFLVKFFRFFLFFVFLLYVFFFDELIDFSFGILKLF